MLNMDYDVEVVEQHPAPLALALAPRRLGARLGELVLDLVDDRLDLPVVRGGAEQECVSDHELLADVVRDDVGGQLVGRGTGRDPDELSGPFCGCHEWCVPSLAEAATSADFRTCRPGTERHSGTLSVSLPADNAE